MKQSKIIILLSLLMSMVSTKTFAYGIEVKNADGVTIYYWDKGKTEVWVDGVEKNFAGDLVIPETIEYEGNMYSVTGIDFRAFRGQSGLTSITIPSSVTTIEEQAFIGCSGLTAVHISSLESWCNIKFDDYVEDLYDVSNPLLWANHLYMNGDEIKDLVIPNSVNSISKYAFWGCKGLTSVTIPNSVESIGNYAFSGCSGLTSVTIGNSVESIGSSAFSGCSGLTSVTIPNSVKSIGNAAFSGCSGLTSVTIGNSVESIGSYAFSGCSGLPSVVIPNSVTYIGARAFADCSNLATIIVDAENTTYNSPDGSNAIVETASNTLVVGCKNTTIPNCVTSIGDYALCSCIGLTSVTIPNSVTSIGYGAFSGCSGLTSVTIPNSVTSIGKYAFEGCIGLTSVTIPNSVTSIGYSAFYNCSGLTSVTIPNSVESIGGDAFYGCSGLTSVTIPNSVTSIGSYAFSGCIGLTSVAIPNSLKSIDYTVFSGCSNLTTITVDVENIVYNSPGGSNAIIETASNTLVVGCKNTTIPNSVESIGESAFYNCIGLTSVTIPNSVTSIGKYAFWNCIGLTSVTIPSSVTSIGSYVFDMCNNLTTIVSEIENPYSIDNSVFSSVFSIAKLIVPKGSINKYKATDGWKSFANIVEATENEEADILDNGIYYNIKSDGSLEVTGLASWTTVADIPSSITIDGTKYRVTSIGAYAFNGRSDITYLSIPYSVKSIGEYAFMGCGSSITVNIADPESWCQMQLGNEHASPLSSAGKMLVHDIETTSFEVPSTVTSVSAFTFYQCSCLKSLYIPSSVISIGSSAFEDCDYLTSLTLSEGLQSIGGSAFDGCKSLSTIAIPSTVNTIMINAFKNCQAINDVYCNATNVPNTDAYAFDGSPIGSATLHVPVSAINEYRDTWPWSGFGKAMTIEGKGDVNGDGVVNDADVKDVASHIMGMTPKGFNKDAADVNNDNKVNAADIVLINKMR